MSVDKPLVPVPLAPVSAPDRAVDTGLLAGRFNSSRQPNSLPSSRRSVRRGDGAYQPLVIAFAAAAVGVVLDRFIPLPALLWLSLAALGWIVWWRLRQHPPAAAIVLLAAVGSLFAAWHHGRWYWYPADAVGAFAHEAAEPACLEATATDGVRRVPAPMATPLRAIPAGARSRFTVRVDRIRDGERWRPATGLALVTVDGTLGNVRAGDQLRLVGQLSAPAAGRNPGEFDFALDARAERREVRLWCEQPECVRVVASGSSFNPRRLIDRCREYGDRALARYIKHDRAGLAAALVVGMREQLDAERGEAFLESGMMHVLSISGLHVGLLALVLFGVLRLGLVARGPALVAIVLLVGFYAVVTDAGAPVVRATTMVALVCASIYWGRPALRFNSLAAAALIVLALNPNDLFRTGPQLSFLAVAAMAWVYPRLPGGTVDEDPLDRLIRLSRPWPQRAGGRIARWLRGALLMSAAIWLITAPLVLARFNVLSPGAIVLNLLFTIPVAAALLSGFGVVLFGWIAPPLASLCGLVCDWNLGLMDRLVTIANRLPGSHFWLPGPANWWLLGFYFGLGAILVLRRWPVPGRWRLALAASWLAVGIGSTWRPSDSARLDCTFVSVGHGSATVVELPGGETLLYDAGQLGAPATGARAIAGTLWSRGITHLDAVVVSHADVDHFNALPELFERFSVGAIYISTVMLENESPAVGVLVEAIRRRGIPLREVSAGNRLKSAGQVLLEFRHPTREGVFDSDNANSLVLAVEYAGRRILLTGDVEGRGLDQILAEEPLDCDVVAAPHHGSPRSNPPGFAAWSTPEWVVISSGVGRGSEEVEAAYRAAGARVLNTARVGAVTTTIRADGISVKAFRP